MATFEHGAAQLRFLVLERKIHMAGGMLREVTHLARDPNILQQGIALQPLLDIAREDPDRICLRCGHGDKDKRIFGKSVAMQEKFSIFIS